MQKLFSIILYAVLFTVVIRSQTMSVKADQDSVKVRQLSELEFTLNNLLAERDIKTYGTYLAEDYVRISANGKMMTKDQVLRDFQNSQPGEAVPEIRQIRIYGDTAIMNIHLTITNQVSGKKITRESLLTKVFILRNGRWVMVSNHGTPLEPENPQQ